MHLSRVILISVLIVAFAGCGKQEASKGPGEESAPVPAGTRIDTNDAVQETRSVDGKPDWPTVEIDEGSFKCLDDMVKVRHFYVDNLLGRVDETVAVARSTDGGVYPPGSVVQLVPTEVMVKHPPGWNAATRDWEFFELDVSEEGSSIRNRGFVDVVNKFGGNCFGCHVKAEPQFDLICEQDHGCDPIPVTREQIAEVQAADPRCTT